MQLTYSILADSPAFGRRTVIHLPRDIVAGMGNCAVDVGRICLASVDIAQSQSALKPRSARTPCARAHLAIYSPPAPRGQESGL